VNKPEQGGNNQVGDDAECRDNRKYESVYIGVRCDEIERGLSEYGDQVGLQQRRLVGRGVVVNGGRRRRRVDGRRRADERPVGRRTLRT